MLRFVWFILPFMAFLSLFFCNAASAQSSNGLPPGYHQPASPYSVPWAGSNRGMSLLLRERNRVIHRLYFDHSPQRWTDRALRFTVGYEERWTPSDYFVFLPKGYETEPNQAFAFIGAEKITFPRHFNVNSSQPMRSTTKPEYTCYRDGPYIVLSKADDRRWYFEPTGHESAWRIKKIELIKHPGQFTEMVYQGRLVTHIYFPNDEIVEVFYENELLSRIDTPFNESIRIERDAGGFVKQIDIYAFEERRGRNVETLIESHKYERDAAGRITRYEAPNGDVYVVTFELDIQRQDGLQRDIYFTTIRRDRDGRFLSRRDEIHDNGEWLTERREGGRNANPHETESHESRRYQKGSKAWRMSASRDVDQNHETAYQRDPKTGHPTTVLNPQEGLTRKQYNDMSMPTRIETANGVTIMQYNSFGQITQQIDPDGQTTVHDYDEHARILESMYPDGHIVRYTYDEDGYPATTETEDRTYRFEYDKWGRLTLYSEKTSRQTVTRAYTYDDYGRLSSETYTVDIENGPENSTETIYEYTNARAGRLAKLNRVIKRPVGGEDQVERFFYERGDRLVRWERPDKQTIIFRYNREGQLALRRDVATGNVHRYFYHEGGRLDQQHFYEGNRLTRIVTYDPRGRRISDEPQ